MEAGAICTDTTKLTSADAGLCAGLCRLKCPSEDLLPIAYSGHQMIEMCTCRQLRSVVPTSTSRGHLR
jgi:hypothetical protein